MKILVDCDGVLADLPNYWLWWLSQVYDGKIRTDKDLISSPWHESINIPEHIDAMFFAECEIEQHCLRLPPYKGARKFVEALKAQGHTVLAYTATANADWTGQRAKWLERMVGIDARKQIIIGREEKPEHHADVLIDDDPGNCRGWASRHPDGVALLFDRPWNQGDYQHKPTSVSDNFGFLPNVLRVSDYQSTLNYLSGLSCLKGERLLTE